MKTDMRRTSILHAAAALVLASFVGISCAKEMTVPEDGTPVTVTGTIVGDASTKVFLEEGTGVIKSEWEVGDNIIGWDGSGNKLELTIASTDRIVGGTAVFTVVSESAALPTQDGQKIYMIYAPGKTRNDLTTSGLIYNLSTQTDKVPALMTAEGTVDKGQINLNFTGALALVAVKNPKLQVSAATAVSSLKLTGNNIRSSVTINKNLQLSASGSGPITRSCSFTTGTNGTTSGVMVYFAVPPTQSTADVTVSTGTPEGYELLKENTDFAAGKCYLLNAGAIVKHKFTITCPAVSNGIFSTSPSGTCAWGETVTVSASPALGYRVDKMTYTDEDNVEHTIMFNSSNKGTFTMPQANTTVKVTFDFVPIDLSDPLPANCYVVPRVGKYKFRAVRGNNSLDGLGTPTSAEVLWESFGTSSAPSKGALVKDPYYENGYVYFTATTSKGNAVIAVKNGSTILWSWHIWLTDEPKDEVYNYGAGTMMDRNLGTTSISGLGSYGLLYQWGRKDPFLGANGVSSTTQAASTGSWSTTAGTQTVDWAVENPTKFITSSSDDWTSQDNNLWGSYKTIYDPCPPGYRVPDGGSGGVWNSAGFATSTANWSSNAYYFNITSGTTRYPAAGVFTSSDGKLANVGSYGYYWSCYTYGESASYLAFTKNHVDPMTYSTRAGGRSIRCLKDGSVIKYTIMQGGTSNGTFSTSPSGSACAGVAVTVMASPYNNYCVDKMTYTPEGGTAQTIDFDPKTNIGTFTMPAKSVTVNVTFTRYGKINGHDFVVIGNLKWATMNVGASSRSDYGDFYAWGETTIKTNYSFSTYTAGGISTNLSGSNDVATVKWQSTWRMPTYDEFVDFYQATAWTWGDGGFYVTDKGVSLNGDKSNALLFFPAAGYHEDDRHISKNYSGYYWTSTFGPYNFFFNASEFSMNLFDFAYQGYSVRPVSD